MVPGLSFALVPFLMLGMVIAALGVGTLLSALTVMYRDFRHVVPFMVQFWMFATPCIYIQKESRFGRAARLLAPLEPRLRPDRQSPGGVLGLPLDRRHGRLQPGGSDPVVLGCLCFRRMEGSFADVI